MQERSAQDKIKGYFYQFDYTIIRLLNQVDDNSIVAIEGIEDIDIETATEITAIQCKYYAKQEYNHSLISKPIRLMLSHFKKLKVEGKPSIKYLMYGFYKEGQNKLTMPIDLTFLKNHFLTYSEEKIKKEHHTELSITDSELLEFINLLTIDINAKEYELQFFEILKIFQKIFQCDLFEAEFYYYNNAISIVKNIAIKELPDERKITKKDFLQRINKRTILFNKWFLEFRGQKEFFKRLKNQYFTEFNKSPFERFFLIDMPSNYIESELKELIFLIGKRYSNLKKMEPKPFSPYIFLNNISELGLINIKKQLQSEDFSFIDGFDFKGSEFSIKSITRMANSTNQIQMKIINDLPNLKEILSFDNGKTKEIYQFYLSSIYFNFSNQAIKQINIQFKELADIKEII